MQISFRPTLTIAVAILGLTVPQSQADAQMMTDTLFAWTGYVRESVCRIRMYRSAPGERKPFVIVVDELAANRGRTTLDDSRHLVELASREMAVDPELAYWIFHWGGFSHDGAESSKKELFFRATFRRSDNGSVGPPFWRLINRETLVAYTDRAYR